MTPGAFSLTLYRGDTYQWTFALWADEDRTVPVDLTGVTANAEIRDAPCGDVSVPLACAIVPPNQINMVLNAAASAALPCPTGRARIWTGVWDLQLTFPGGDDRSVRTILAGAVAVTPDVTFSTPQAQPAALKVVA